MSNMSVFHGFRLFSLPFSHSSPNPISWLKWCSLEGYSSCVSISTPTPWLPISPANKWKNKWPPLVSYNHSNGAGCRGGPVAGSATGVRKHCSPRSCGPGYPTIHPRSASIRTLESIESTVDFEEFQCQVSFFVEGSHTFWPYISRHDGLSSISCRCPPSLSVAPKNHCLQVSCEFGRPIFVIRRVISLAKWMEAMASEPVSWHVI